MNIGNAVRAAMDDSQTAELECTICGNIMVDPRVLSCQHAFCLRCIFCLIKRDRGMHVAVKCPFGCEEQTVTEGDVRTLKKNHLIGSLCRRATEKRFAALPDPKKHACDFCSKDNVQCRLCQRCSGSICERCDAEENFSDHGFLCCDNKKSVSNSNVTGDQPANESEKSHFLFTPAQVIARAEEEISARLKTAVKCSTEVLPFYCPLERHSCRARIRLDGKEMDVNYTVQIGHVGPELVELYDNVNFSSSELKMLSTILSCLEEIEESLETMERALRECTLQLRLTRCVKDLTAVAHLSVAIKALLVIERVVTESFLQRVTLMANLLGHSVIERWYQLHHSGDPVQKKQLKAKIHAHLQMSALFADAIHKKMIALTKTSQGSFKTLQNVSKLLVTTAAKICSQPSRSEAFSIANLVGAVSESAKKIFGVTTYVKQVALTSVAEATCGSGFVGEAVERCVSSEKHLSVECDKLLGFCGSILHLHVLWNQMVVVLPQTESSDLQRFLASLDNVTLFEPRGNIDHIVNNVVPQIQLVRVQHLSLLTQHPDHVDQHRQLQSQLCTLISQTLELFGKEHTVLVQHACEAASAYLIEFTHVLFDIFAKHRHHLSVDVSGAVAESEVLDMSEAAVFRRSIDHIITALRSELRRNPSMLRKKTVEIRRMQCLSLLSELFLAQGSRSSTAAGQPQDCSLESRLRKERRTDEIRALAGDATFTQKESASKRVAQLLKRDAPRGVAIEPVSVIASRVCYHPFYSGTFRLVGEGEEDYPFFVSGQTVAVVFSTPPKKGLAWMLGVCQQTLASLVLFHMVNAALCIFATHKKKASSSSLVQ